MIEGVVTKIRRAKSVNEIRAILNYANWTNPSGNMRRRFLAAAAEKIKELEDAKH